MLLFQKARTKIINNKIIVVLIILLVIISGILTFKTIRDNQKSKEEDELISSFFNFDKEISEDTNDSQQQFEVDKQKIKNKEQYVGILQIPSINLQKGFYKIGSRKNTVNYGLEIISGSRMPNEKNSELVLAGHSGNGYLAFFKELDKVEKGSLIYVYYDEIKYTYKLEETTITNKDGEIKIEKDANSQTLILTTCNPDNRDKEQLILISKLINKEKYRNGE